MKICTVGEIKDYFRNSKSLLTDSCYVSGALRRKWMLNHEITVIHGKIRSVTFKNMGSGVWRASIQG